MSKIDLIRVRNLGLRRPYKKIYLGGTFDCLHRGHLNLFKNAGAIASKVVIALNTDEFAERYKRRPVLSLADRMAVLEQCRLVDEVIVNEGGENSTISIITSGADAIGHGDDWVGEALMKQMGFTAHFLKEHRISLVYLPYTLDISTTKIIEGIVPKGR